jgi:uncharacterized protein YecT (DUF1311 family)
MKKIIAWIGISAVLSSNSFAIDCQNAMTTYDMKYCAKQELEIADKKLNEVYNELIKKADAIEKSKLIAAQRAWIKFRDAEAEYASDYARGGTAEGLFYLSSLTKRTQKRIAELEAYLKEKNL